MYVKDIIRDVDIYVMLDSGESIKTRYINMVDHIRFSVKSSELAQLAPELKGHTLMLHFFQEAADHELSAVLTDWIDDEVIFRALAEIKKYPVRENIRITHTLKVSVWDGAQYLGDGLSNDLSKSGMGMWSDHELEHGKFYTLGFLLKTDCRIRAKLVRKQLNTTTKTFKYEYGFVFVIDDEKEQEALVFGILDVKIRSMER